MEIETTKIKVNERVRKEFPNIGELADSIKELGLLQPILVSKNNELIAGHRRLLACKQLGLKRIECNKINPSNELQRLDMELAENVKREDFNPMELSDGLAKRKELYLFEHPETKVGATGGGVDGKGTKTKTDLSESDNSVDRFTLDTAKILNVSEAKVKETLQLQNIKEEDKQKVRDNKLNKSQALASYRKEKKIAKLKEAVKEIKAEELNLYHGDCLDEIKKLEDNSISCLIIDPPYGIDYQSNFKLAKHDKISNDKSESLDLLKASLEKIKPKMKTNSHLYIFTTWKVYEKVKPIVGMLFDVKNCLIWNKNNWSMGDLEGNYAEKYEMIIFATQGKRSLVGNKRPVNVLDFERTTNSNHPTEKPVELIKELIKNSTVEGELVLDYFAGSGSTLVASKELKRRFIGIESSEEYINVIKDRLK